MFYANYVRERMRTLPEFEEAEGNPVIIEDSLKRPLRKLHVFGESVQNGTPTPDAPLDIASVENPVIRVTGNNLFNIDAITTSINNGDGTLTVKQYPQHSGVTLKKACPIVKTGDNIVFRFTTTSSIKIAYLNNGKYITPGKTFTVTDGDLNAEIMFYCQRVDGVNSPATISNIQVTFEGCSDVYEPYIQPQEVVLDGITLRGLQDTNGETWNDEIIVDSKNKTVKHRECVRYWNSLETPVNYSVYTRDETNNIAKYYSVRIGSSMWYAYPKYCTHFRYQYGIDGNTPYCFSHGDASSNVYFKVPLDEYPTPADFKAFMDANEVEFICKLNVPIETDITDTEAGQALLGLYTNKGITRISLGLASNQGEIKVKYVRK